MFVTIDTREKSLQENELKGLKSWFLLACMLREGISEKEELILEEWNKQVRHAYYLDEMMNQKKYYLGTKRGLNIKSADKIKFACKPMSLPEMGTVRLRLGFLIPKTLKNF